MTILEELKAKVEPYKNTLVIDVFNIVLLKDVIDGNDDYYYVMYGNCFGYFGTYHATCVGTFYPLKGILPDEQYQRLVTLWNLNNDEKAV